MTSNDMSTLTLLLEKHFAETARQLSDMRTDNAEFRKQMKQDMHDFEERVTTKIEALDEKLTGKIEALDEKFTGKIEALDEKLTGKVEALDEKFTDKIEALDEKFTGKIDGLQEQIVVMHDDITGLKHDVAGLYHWDYWLLSIIIAVIAMPQIASGVKLLFSAVAEGLGLIMSVFRKEGK